MKACALRRDLSVTSIKYRQRAGSCAVRMWRMDAECVATNLMKSATVMCGGSDTTATVRPKPLPPISRSSLLPTPVCSPNELSVRARRAPGARPRYRIRLPCTTFTEPITNRNAFPTPQPSRRASPVSGRSPTAGIAGTVAVAVAASSGVVGELITAREGRPHAVRYTRGNHARESTLAILKPAAKTAQQRGIRLGSLGSRRLGLTTICFSVPHRFDHTFMMIR